ncbi:uncharacterized protein LOC127719075 isoform X2 [Mytilus californianus]|uniref:uncharacterized protein LOC127719075 isoform X2 n=1 Tax=Mytilus californianus TaxID=6549 RepID=UPI002245051B|nr:uncharacterized protein LOC127719075 isoform X2 [Mytilus californianus]
MALVQENNIDSSDDESHIDNKIFSDFLLSRIADHLLDDWVPVLIQLGLQYSSVKKIEKAYPNELYRQSLEGLMQWRKSISRNDVGIPNATNELLSALEEKGRKDMVDLVAEFKENIENQNPRKRCLTTYESHSCKRKTLSLKSGNDVYQAVEEMEYEYTLNLNGDGETPSHSTVHYQLHQEGKGFKTTEQVYTNQKLNNEILTVLVDHKSPIIPFGRNARKPRIALLLSTGSEYIKASAFGDHADFIDKNMENDMVYRISGYQLKTSDYSNNLELTLYQTTKIEVVSRAEIPKQVKRNFRIDDIKQKRYVRKLRTIGPVVVTSVGPTRRPWNNYLKEVMLKDHNGRIIMNMWRSDNKIPFAYRRGDVLVLQNVEVGMFKSYSGIVYHLTGGDVVKFIQIPGYDMQDLLHDEDEHFLTPITMKVNDLKDMKEYKHLVYINFVKIEVFVKDSNTQKIFKHCDVVETHGSLSEKEGRWFCDECEEYTDGENKAKLTAEVVDAHDHSKNSLWVNLYDKSVQTVLGDSYTAFIQTENEKKRASILKKCELKNRVYRLELKYDPKYSTQSVKKLTVI